MSFKDKVLEAARARRKPERVFNELLGMEVGIKRITNLEFGAALKNFKKTGAQEAESGLAFQRQIVAMALTDPDTGEAMFQANELGPEFDQGLLKQVFESIMDYNGLTDKGKEAVEGN